MVNPNLDSLANRMVWIQKDLTKQECHIHQSKQSQTPFLLLSTSGFASKSTPKLDS